MNQSTKDQFAAILAAAQNKANVQSIKVIAPIPEPKKDANGVQVFDTLKDITTAAQTGQTISILNLANLVQADKKVATIAPEMSNTTFDSIFTTQWNDGIYPTETQEPENQEQVKAKVQIVNYSDRSFAVIGETKPIKDVLRSLGGSFNAHLTCGIGWIFSKKHLQAVKTKLAL